MVNCITDERKRLKTEILLKIDNMGKKDKSNKTGYINPAIVKAAAGRLQEYIAEHPNCDTPMSSYWKEAAIKLEDRARFVRAAQQLGLPVVRSGGNVYENGVLVWVK